jgi:FtsH-binding integral membrane protein
MYNLDTEEKIVYQTTAFASLMRKVYVWMALALVVSGLTAMCVAQNASLMTAIMTHPASIWVLCIAEIGLVIYLTARINKMSFPTAGILFVVYSILNGVTLSFVFLAYTLTSITSTFFITAGTFAAMSLIGYNTKKDLSGIGRYLLFALVGLIIASVVNIFLASSPLQWLISFIGVIVFVGLTAYDTQKIKQMFLMYGDDVNESTQKLALMGSLSLYLDFINLFLYLLRFFGDRK